MTRPWSATVVLLFVLFTGCATVRQEQTLDDQLQALEIAYLAGEIDTETYEALRADLIATAEQSPTPQNAALIRSLGSTNPLITASPEPFQPDSSIITINTPGQTISHISPSD